MEPFLNKHYDIISNLFFNYGIKSISIEDIAKKTGTSKKTIYKEYKCKDDLVREFFISEYTQLKQKMKSLVNANLNAITQIVQLYFLVHRKIILINPSVLFDLKKYYPDLFREAIALHRKTIKGNFFLVLMRGKKENLFLQNIDAGSIANLITVLIESCVYSRLIANTNEWTMTPNHFLDFHFRGICTPMGLDKWESQKKELINGFDFKIKE
jgi:AcrR family transcriptional regulator